MVSQSTSVVYNADRKPKLTNVNLNPHVEVQFRLGFRFQTQTLNLGCNPLAFIQRLGFSLQAPILGF